MDPSELTPPPLPEPPPRGLYGFWSTFGLGLVTVIVMIVVQAVIGFGFGLVAGIRLAMSEGSHFSASEVTSRLVEHPLFLPLCVLVAIPPVLATLWLFTFLRRIPFSEYLGLRRFRLGQLLLWLGVLIVTLFVSDWILRSLGETNMDQSYIRTMVHPGYLPVILLAVIVGAPLVEELIFRGFMFTGMARSRLTTVLAILLPNLIWVSMHVQYRPPTLCILFIVGVLFALARHFSRSTWVPVLLHATMNGIAMVGVISLLYPWNSWRGFDFKSGTPWRYSLLGYEAARDDRDEDAVKYYSSAIAIDPDYRDALRGRARAYYALEDWEGAIADYARISQLDPRDTNAAYWRGCAQVQDENFEAAITDFDQVLKINPNYGRAYWMRGYAHYELGHYQAAIADETEAIKRIPDLGSAYNDRGRSHEELGEIDEAIADYSAAIRVEPDLDYVFNNRGVAYQKNGNLDLAIRDFNSAIRLAPRRGRYHVNRADTLKLRGDFSEAVSGYRRAGQLNPRYAHAWNALAWILATCPEDTVRNGALAAENARKAIELTEWKQTRYFESMAAACAESGKFAEAVWWQQRRLSDPDLSSSLREDAEARLHAYELRQPWREKDAATSDAK